MSRSAVAMERLTAALENEQRHRHELARLELDRRLPPIDDRPPKRVGWGLFLLAIPGLAGQFKPVPDEYLESADYGRQTVRCPCDERPTIATEEAECCPCGRTYLNSGRGVWVANSPSGRPEGRS